MKQKGISIFVCLSVLIINDYVVYIYKCWLIKCSAERRTQNSIHPLGIEPP